LLVLTDLSERRLGFRSAQFSSEGPISAPDLSVPVAKPWSQLELSWVEVAVDEDAGSGVGASEGGGGGDLGEVRWGGDVGSFVDDEQQPLGEPVGCAVGPVVDPSDDRDSGWDPRGPASRTAPGRAREFDRMDRGAGVGARVNAQAGRRQLGYDRGRGEPAIPSNGSEPGCDEKL